MNTQPLTSASSSLPQRREEYRAITSGASMPKSVQPTQSIQGESPFSGPEYDNQKTFTVSPIDLDKCKNCSLLYEAVDANNASFVSYLLEHSDDFTFDINKKHTLLYRWTALHLAAKKGNATIVRMFLLYGSALKLDINQLDNFGRTALHIAASEGHDPIVRMLVQQTGIKLNIKDKFSESTPLLCTFGEGKTHLSTMKILLEAGCCIEEGNNKAVTPLHLASRMNRTSSVGLLLGNLRLSPQ